MNMKRKIINEIMKNGKEVGNTIEIVDYAFTIKHHLKLKLTDKQQEYVENKILRYSYYTLKLVQELKLDINSRRAIIQFQMDRIPPECTSNIHFMIRENKLIVLVNQRSFDVEKHFETDVETVQLISDLICRKFGLKLDYIRFHVNSCHVYKK